MQTQVTFYILADENDSILPASYFQACHMAAHYYRQNQRVFIYTADQTKAHDIDELLWAFEPESFVPHNLVGEGPNYGSPVEISWQGPTNRRPILINLTDTVPAFAGQFSQIIDFVPVEEQQKQLARERFKNCRQLGFVVNTENLAATESSST